MNEAVVALIAALGAALLTAAGSLGVVRYQEKLRGQSDDAGALATIVTELLSRSFALAVRAKTTGETAKIRSGLSEGVDVATRQRKPLDLLEFHDWLEKDFAPLRDAWSDLWTRGDQELVDAANRLMLTCSDMVGTTTETMPIPDFSARVRRFVRGEAWTRAMTERLESCEKALSDARRELTFVARRKLGRALIDPYNRDDATDET